MNGNANDISPNHNNGEIIGGVNPVTDRFNHLCSALRFNGTNGYLSVPSSPSLKSPTKGLSVAVWVKIDQFCNDSDRDWFTILCKSDQSSQNKSSPQYRFQASTMTLSLNESFSDYIEYSIEFDTWYFLTLTFGEQKVRFFSNAELVATFPYNGSLQPNDLDLEIGRDMPGSPEFFCGTMDDLRIYDRALTFQEIANLYKINPALIGMEKVSLTCPADMTVQNAEGKCSAIVNYKVTSNGDNCATITPKRVTGPESGSEFPMGETPVAWSAKAPDGSNLECSFKVKVIDTEKPKLDCPGDIHVKGAPGETNVEVKFRVKATDNCELKDLNLLEGFASGSLFPIGETKVKYQALDQAGNKSVCNFLVEVSKINKLELLCPHDIQVPAEPGQCDAVVKFASPDAMTDFAWVMVTQRDGPKSNSRFPLGETRLTFDGAGPEGQKDQCSFKIEVLDQEAPKIQCPPDQTIIANPNQTSAQANYPHPKATDNCELSGITLLKGPKSGADTPIGSYQITFQAADKSGNKAECTFKMLIKAVEKLEITCPKDLFVNTDPGQCGARIAYTLPEIISGPQGSIIQRTGGPQSNAMFPVGRMLMTFEASSPNGLTQPCAFKVEVEDKEPPKITCPANISVQTQPGETSAKITWDQPKASDNCGAEQPVIKEGLKSGSEFPPGKTRVTYAVTDNSNNQAECSFEVTVEQVKKLDLTCPENIKVNTDPGNCTARVRYSQPKLSSDGPEFKLVKTEGPDSESSFPQGETLIKYEAKGPKNQTANCSFSVTVRDLERPALTCPANVSVESTPGESSARVDYPAPQARDNCAIDRVFLTQGQESGAEFPGGKTIITYTAVDKSGNKETCTFEIKVRRIEKLDLTCPSDIRKNTDPGICGAIINFSQPLATDGVPELKITQTEGPANNSKFPTGESQMVFKATSSDGQSANCSFKVLVSDLEKPQINCPKDIQVQTQPGATTAKVEFVPATATDNCSIKEIAQTVGPKSGSEFPADKTEITYLASDASGNTASCTFAVNVAKIGKLELACPADLKVNSDPGNCTASVKYETPKVTGLEGIEVKRKAGPESGAKFNPGETILTFEASGPGGQSTNCSFKVLVSDLEKPQINCPKDIQVQTQPGATTAKVEFAPATATDNCSIKEIAQTAGPKSGSEFPAGKTEITYLASDASGNTSNCTFTVNVAKIGKLELACPADLKVNSDPGNCTASVKYETPKVTGLEGIEVKRKAGPESGGKFSSGETILTFEANGPGEQSTNCSFKVLVSDLEKPQINCPKDLQVQTQPGATTAKVEFAPATATDNCSIKEIAQTAGIKSGSEFPADKTEITYLASDASGNTSNCTFTVNVAKIGKLELACPADLKVNSDPGNCTASVKYEMPVVIGIEGIEVKRKAGPESGGKFNSGETVLSFEASGPGGQSAACSFKVVVSDLEKPQINCPKDLQVQTQPGATTSKVEFAPATATDNCSIKEIAQTAGPKSGSEFPAGKTEVTYLASDASGNTSNCTFTVNVAKIGKLELACPEDMKVNADPGNCTASVKYETPKVTGLEGIEVKRKAGPESGGKFSSGETLLTFEASGPGGQSASCSFKVLVSDLEKPQINCPKDIQVQTLPGATTAKVEFAPATATDNCSIKEIAQTVGPKSGSEFQSGKTEITYLASDASGNTSNCTFTVNVAKIGKLELACPEDMKVNADPGNCTASVKYETPKVTGLEGIEVKRKAGPESGGKFSSGETLLTFEASGPGGQSASCSFKVLVSDLEKPQINCPKDIQVQTLPGATTAKVEFAPATATDNCSIKEIAQTVGPKSGSEFQSGKTEITYLASDASGNTSNCTFTVNVAKIGKLELACPADLKVNADPGNCTASVKYETPQVIGLEGIEVKRKAGPESGGKFNSGETLLTFEASGPGGQSASCSFKVLVSDLEKPQFNCPKDIQVQTQPGATTAKVEFAPATATDNCSIKEIAQTAGPKSGSEFPAGKTEITFLASDASGNTSNCTFTVNVAKIGKLELACPADLQVNSDPGNCTASVKYETPKITGLEGIEVKRKAGPESGGKFNSGETVLSFEASGPGGQSANCSFKVLVSDLEKPQINCPKEIQVQTQPGATTSKVEFAPATATDNCSIKEIAQTAGPKSGSEFPAGSTQITFHARDAAGNADQCSFMVEVIAVRKLVLICPDDITVCTDPAKCSAKINYESAHLEGDNTGVVITSPSDRESGADFPKGVTSLRYQANDTQGQTASCTFKVKVEDKVEPEISCPENIQASTQPGAKSAKVSFANATATDNCGKTDLRLSEGLASGSEFPIGETKVAFTAMDESGNTASCEFSVQVGEVAGLRIKCPPDLRLRNDPGECGARVDYKVPSAKFGEDDLPVQMSKGLASGATFPVGSTPVVYEVTAPNGESTKCGFRVQILDVEDPQINCPDDLVVQAPFGEKSMKVKYPPATALDNCGELPVTRASGPESGAVFPLGKTLVSWSTTDQNDRKADCNFEVTVLEMTEITDEKDLPKVLDGDSVDYQNTVIVRSPNVKIYYYDNESEDGDIVSLNFDGNWVVTETKIKAKKKDIRDTPNFELQLSEGKIHFLVSKAHNLGREGINTLTLAIYDGVTSPRIIRMNSKIGESGAIKIAYVK
ncbi:MAG: HYR domain-containing protein [Bacteroidia bacterium]|nr:HYR domain-containing protein [Bacteroidia bacterium]